MLEVQVHVENTCVTPVDSFPLFHTLTQEAVMEGKASGLGIRGRHLGPDVWNFLVGWDSRDMMEVRSHDGQETQS